MGGRRDDQNKSEHLNWDVMRFVFGFMCCGSGREIFDILGLVSVELHCLSQLNVKFAEFVESVEDLIRFMFSVAAAAVSFLFNCYLFFVLTTAVRTNCFWNGSS
jgi:hypothetical protein